MPKTPSRRSARVSRWLGWLRRGLGASMAGLGLVVFWSSAAWNAERLASGPAVVLDTTWPRIAQGCIFLGVLLAGWPSSVNQRPVPRSKRWLVGGLATFVLILGTAVLAGAHKHQFPSEPLWVLAGTLAPLLLAIGLIVAVWPMTDAGHRREGRNAVARVGDPASS